MAHVWVEISETYNSSIERCRCGILKRTCALGFGKKLLIDYIEPGCDEWDGDQPFCPLDRSPVKEGV